MNNPFKGKYGPLLIAEIGGNHEGNFDYAKKLTQLAIDTNVDVIKYQLYTGDGLVNKLESPSRNEHFKKFELTKEQHLELAKTVTDAGIIYMASVWNFDMIPWIDPFIPIYKIGSGDMTAYPVLKTIAQKGKPMIVSTGLSKEKEVLDTINFIQSINPIYKNKTNLAILQCTSMYPIPNADANLSVIPRLKELTGLTIGYSDHTETPKALEIAYAMGAEVLEFHFTDTKANKSFRDHKVSLTPTDVSKLIGTIQEINTLKGNPIKTPLQIEKEAGHDISFRRAVYPAMDIPQNTVITEKHLTVKRPNHGIDARDYYKLIGKKTKKDLKQNEKLFWKFFE